MRSLIWFLLGFLASTVFWTIGVPYIKSEAIASTLPAVQIYAGDDVDAAVKAATEAAPPALYVCSMPKETVYMVIAPQSLEYMIFDGDGAFLNMSTFYLAQTDTGVEYLHGEMGNALLGFVQRGDHWLLAVTTDKKTIEFRCK